MQIRIRDGLDYDCSIVGVCRLMKADKLLRDDCVFDFSGVSFMHVGVIAAIAMYVRCISSQRRVLLRAHQDSPCHQYLQRINFYDSLGLSLEESFHRHEAAGEFLEITEIIDDESYTANTIPAKLREIIARAAYIDISLCSAIDQSFGEILDNVLNHSRTTVPGIAVAQHYPKKGCVEFCVADAGIGIAQSLRTNPKFADWDSGSLVQSAFQYGIGENVYGARGGDEGYGCGYGLAFASRLVEVAGGTLWAVSRDESLVITPNGLEHDRGCWFPGTLICARIPDRATVTERDLDVAGLGLPDKPYYWDAQGNDIDDLFGEDGILW